MRYSLKLMEWTSFIFWKQLYSIWPNTAGWLLGFFNVNSKLFLKQNHLLLIFKIYIYNSRRSESLIMILLTRVKNIEEKISVNNEKKNILCTREKGSKLKMFWKPKLFDILPDLIHPLSRGVGGGGVGLKRGSKEKKMVFSKQRDG